MARHKNAHNSSTTMIHTKLLQPGEYMDTHRWDETAASRRHRAIASHPLLLKAQSIDSIAPARPPFRLCLPPLVTAPA